MLNERRVIELIKAFIKNPNVESANKLINCNVDAFMCNVDDEGRFCRGCVWTPVCWAYKVYPVLVTDEQISAMVLDAMRILAIYEAENA
jgi:hypothetical protein